MSRRSQLARAALLASTLPFLGGAGVCGVVLVDITQRDLILDPVTTIDFAVDRGGIEVYAFDRNGVSLFYYMIGSLEVIGDVGHEITGDELAVFSECDDDKGDFCTVSWYAEVMLGSAVSVRSGDGAVKITGVDDVITADVQGGGFDGVGLRAPALDLTVGEGDVNVEWVATPMQVAIEVDAGNVALTLPAGTYRCDLDTADGDIDTTGVTCDDAAPVTIGVTVREAGNIVLFPGA